ncbi:predicted protein [Streptomyces viridosporus ATCC 14672]|uniref:Predicted protein n=1 Tax=Streptomyces viridosporus (strain ATCC 14672 / DSM 40746 / JCM 4963 / KCTC 9882 / NRRL B-12104 / FH 1290) TaxID=566461 RepID=D6A045_STRV1|nr:predicted protein [Streptomyces viridosporus ATCC 14672]
MLPAAVPCRETTWNGSASSGHPQYGQTVPVVPVTPVVLVMLTPRFRSRGSGPFVATQQGCAGTSVHVQVDFANAIVKRGLHD